MSLVSVSPEADAIMRAEAAEAKLAAIYKAASEPDERVAEVLSSLRDVLNVEPSRGLSTKTAHKAIGTITTLQTHRAAESAMYRAACEQMKRDGVVINELNDELNQMCLLRNTAGHRVSELEAFVKECAKYASAAGYNLRVQQAQRLKTYHVEITISGTVKAASAEHAQNLVHQTVNSNAPIAVADITLSVSEAGTR